MFEPLQVLLTVMASLMVIASLWAMGFCLIVVPLVALGALPTYASMIALEVFIDRHFNRRCPSPLRFRKPQTFAKKFWMNTFASLTTLLGVLIAIKMVELSRGGHDVGIGAVNLFTRATDPDQFFLIATFWIVLVVVYAVSYWHDDDPENSLNKLEWLSLPEWANKVFAKLIH